MNADISLVAFDFSTKEEYAIRPDEVGSYRERGMFVWAEVDGSTCSDSPATAEACQALMESLGMSEEVQLGSWGLMRMAGMVSHRTNKVVNRLTVISVIFLPLSFLCGVYGVNLRGSPEVELAYGYWYFWGLCLVISGGGAYLHEAETLALESWTGFA